MYVWDYARCLLNDHIKFFSSITTCWFVFTVFVKQSTHSHINRLKLSSVNKEKLKIKKSMQNDKNNFAWILFFNSLTACHKSLLKKCTSLNKNSINTENRFMLQFFFLRCNLTFLGHKWFVSTRSMNFDSFFLDSSCMLVTKYFLRIFYSNVIRNVIKIILYYMCMYVFFS